jgi:hypothetical protein
LHWFFLFDIQKFIYKMQLLLVSSGVNHNEQQEGLMVTVTLKFPGEGEALVGGKRIEDAHKGVVVDYHRDTASFTYSDDEAGNLLAQALVNTAPEHGIVVVGSPFNQEPIEIDKISA